MWGGKSKCEVSKVCQVWVSLRELKSELFVKSEYSRGNLERLVVLTLLDYKHQFMESLHVIVGYRLDKLITLDINLFIDLI